jgi:hypothetical protein
MQMSLNAEDSNQVITAGLKESNWLKSGSKETEAVVVMPPAETKVYEISMHDGCDMRT